MGERKERSDGRRKRGGRREGEKKKEKEGYNGWEGKREKKMGEMK